MPAGRPTDYRPEFCEQVVALGKEGKSLVVIANSLGVVKNTLAAWCEEHPEFLSAMTHARQLSQQWWEDVGQDALFEGTFQASMWSRSMAARFPDDWREHNKTELLGKDGQPFSVKLIPDDGGLL